MEDSSLAFIGGGYVARALIGGLITRGWPATSIRVSDPVPAQRISLAADFPGVHVVADNLEAAAGATTWVFAVKPQIVKAVATGLAAAAQAHRPLVISVAAGVRARAIGRWLGDGIAVVRAMPNRPALLGFGCSGLYAGPQVQASHRHHATEILGAVGSCVWVDDEPQMDAVTAVSGSGPAYVFLLIEMLEAAAVQQGLPAPAARRLALETAYGAAAMAHELSEEPATLRAQVTTKGGTTEAALAVLQEAGVHAIFLRAVAAARRRSAELADENGD